MNTLHTNIIVQHFLQCLTNRDLEPLCGLFSDNIDWFIPGNDAIAPWLGKRNSKAAVKEFYQLLWQQTEPVAASVDKIFIDGNQAVITGEFSTRMLATQKIVDSLFSLQLSFDNGLITRYRLLEDSYAVAESMRMP